MYLKRFYVQYRMFLVSIWQVSGTKVPKSAHNVKTVSEIELHFIRIFSSHLNKYKVCFFDTLVPQTCHILRLTVILIVKV